MIMNSKKYSALIAVLALLTNIPPASADETTELFQNLAPVKDAQIPVAYVDPNADFSVFNRVMILDTYVAFRSNWQRDQNRGGRSNRVSARDMERIKADVATLFNEVLADQLSANDGYEIANEPGDDVLVVRAAIIDLDIAAPDTSSSSMTRTFTASSSAATLYIQMFDSVTGQILARGADRQAVRSSSSGWMTWTNRVTNAADARRVFRGWAELLRTFLDNRISGESASQGD